MNAEGAEKEAGKKRREIQKEGVGSRFEIISVQPCFRHFSVFLELSTSAISAVILMFRIGDWIATTGVAAGWPGR